MTSISAGELPHFGSIGKMQEEHRISSICNAPYPQTRIHWERVEVSDEAMQKMDKIPRSSVDSTLSSILDPGFFVDISSKHKKEREALTSENACGKNPVDLQDILNRNDQSMRKEVEEALECNAPKWRALIKFLNKSPTRNTLIFLPGVGVYEVPVRNFFAKLLVYFLDPPIVPMSESKGRPARGGRYLDMGCPGKNERSVNNRKYRDFNQLCADEDNGHVLVLTGADYQSRDFRGISRLILLKQENPGVMTQLVGRAARFCSQAGFKYPWTTEVVIFVYSPQGSNYVDDEDDTIIPEALDGKRSGCDYMRKLLQNTRQALEKDVTEIMKSAGWGCRTMHALQATGRREAGEAPVPSCAQYPVDRKLAEVLEKTQPEATISEA